MPPVVLIVNHRPSYISSPFFFSLFFVENTFGYFAIYPWMSRMFVVCIHHHIWEDTFLSAVRARFPFLHTHSARVYVLFNILVAVASIAFPLTPSPTAYTHVPSTSYARLQVAIQTFLRFIYFFRKKINEKVLFQYYFYSSPCLVLSLAHITHTHTHARARSRVERQVTHLL